MQEQFKQTYFEECEDRIQEAEEGLSLMLDGQCDSDTVNQVFRGIHSIKGGAGAFAFEQIVEFAHQFETALDYVREGKLQPDRDMCNTFLRANDIVAEMLNMERSGQSIEAGYGGDILQELEAITEQVSGAPAKKTVSDDEVATSDGREKTWSIIFRPHEGMLKTGNEPLLLIRSLKELGDLKVTSETDTIPNFNDVNPENCYIGWRLLLKTSTDESEIRKVFDFVDGVCELEIEIQNVPPGNEPERREPNTAEALLDNIKRKEDMDVIENKVIGSKSIRVDLDRIDHLVNLVGEMVIAQSMLQEQVRWLPQDIGGKIGEDVENLSRHMRDLQESVMSVRAQPIKSVFTRMPRIIREVASACGKDVRLTTYGEETEVDKTVLENLIDPLTHMIRNSVDHGIETREAREDAGKPAYGTIELSARHRSGRIIIEVQDDGKGVNREAVLTKAKKQGLIEEDAQLTPMEIDNLIFKPGFSTAESVSAVSGRGVGMDVVKRNITNLGGRINVVSTPGKGCRMTLSLPLTLAVMDGMIVSVGSQRFVLPTISIIESFRPTRGAIGKLADDVNVIRARGEYVRIIPLCNLFQIDDAIYNPEEALVILLESEEGDRIAVMVDDVLGQQQVVIKSLETNFKAISGISAATILGDGDVALILDVPGLTDMKAGLNLRQEMLEALERIKDVEYDSIDNPYPSVSAIEEQVSSEEIKNKDDTEMEGTLNHE